MAGAGGLRAVLRVAATIGDVGAALADLVLPADCPGCGGQGPLCAGCRQVLAGSAPRPVRPEPAPPGLPPCHAAGWYAGSLRGLLLGYKERGRRWLAGPLGERLATVVAAACPGGDPVVLVPVPATARAARARGGDHLLPLAAAAVRSLRRGGRPAAVVPAVAARPRPDSAGLSSAARLRFAADAFRVRRAGLGGLGRALRAGARVVVVDDIVTTDATAAAMATLLAGHGTPVAAVAVVAATRRRTGRKDHLAVRRTYRRTS